MNPRLFRFLVAAALSAAAATDRTGPAPAVYTLNSQFQRIVVVRLKNQTDILEGLKQAVAREKVKNAIFISGMGSVTRYSVHVVKNTVFPPVDEFPKAEGPYDILGVNGMVIDGKVHAHITLANPQKAIGGHIEPGTSVFTFAMITLGVLRDSDTLNRFDDYQWH